MHSTLHFLAWQPAIGAMEHACSSELRSARTSEIWGESCLRAGTVNPTCGCFLTFSENGVCQLVALGGLWLPGNEAVRADLSPPLQPEETFASLEGCLQILRTLTARISLDPVWDIFISRAKQGQLVIWSKCSNALTQKEISFFFTFIFV